MTDVSFKPSSTAPVTSPHGELVTDLAQESLSRAATALRTLSFRSLPYHPSLSGPLPDRIVYFPVDFAPRSPQTRLDLMSHRYVFPGGLVQANGQTPPWRLVPPSEEWAEALHGFSWLRHFESNRDQNAKDHIHWLMSTWLKECGQWHSIGWRPPVLARRLISWFMHSKLILREADLVWRSMVLRSLVHQARYLFRAAKWASCEGEGKIVVATGLSFSGLCLPDGAHRLERGLAMLIRELDRQILPDGGHISRDPSVQLAILLDIVSLKDALVEQNYPVPDNLQDMIGRMAPMLRFFRMGDGRLALFNGSAEEDGGAIESILSRPDTRAKTYSQAPYSGYQRIKAGRTCLIMDTGRAPRRGFSRHAHAGCLSFEMSVGRHRLIVNCGAAVLQGEAWKNAARATAAHSTITLADKSSATMIKHPFIAGLLGPRIAAGPEKVTCLREENEEGIWLLGSHDGYQQRFGLLHERRLYVRSNGEDVRGEDSLHPPSQTGALAPKRVRRAAGHKGTAIPFTLRFHLHPEVKASLARDASRVLLLLPNGDGWRFQTNQPGISLEESVYLGKGDVGRRSFQITVPGITGVGEPCAIKWALRRLSGSPEAGRL